MKKSGKVLLLLLLLLLLAFSIVLISTQKIVKDQNGIIPLLKEEFQLTENHTISYIGEFSLGTNILYWFSIQIQDGYEYRFYRAVECSLLRRGKYKVKNIYKPMVYTDDIVHVLWRANDVYLINRTDCHSIIYQNNNGDGTYEITLLPSDFPYIFLNNPPFRSSTLDFLDSERNPIK